MRRSTRHYDCARVATRRNSRIAARSAIAAMRVAPSLAAIIFTATAFLSPPALAYEGHEHPLAHVTDLIASASGLFSQQPQNPDPSPISSATTLLNELVSAAPDVDPDLLEPLGTYLERPLDLAAECATTHFRLHFATEGADLIADWPDSTFLNAAASACETSWTFYHTTQNWPEPLPDGAVGGDWRIDVYIRDLGARVYGYSLHEELPGQRGCTGFIVIDNDYVGLLEAATFASLQLTIAHEYQHLVQFGFGYDPANSWFMEQCATMLEGRVYPDASDVQRHLDIYAGHPYLPLDLCNGSFEYGAWLWPQFLAERGGDRLLVDVWTAWRDGAGTMVEALDQVLGGSGGLDQAFSEWVEWNAFLGASDDGAHYANARAYDCSIAPEAVVDHYPADAISPVMLHRPAPLGASYVELLRQPGSADNHLTLHLTAESGATGGVLIVWRESGQADVVRFAFEQGIFDHEISAWDIVSRVLIAVVTGKDADQPCDYALSVTTLYITAGVEDEPEVVNGLRLRGSPSPFDPFTVLSFQLAERANVSLRILDAQGRLVEQLIDAACSPGVHAVRWGGPGAEPAGASGVYFAEIRVAGARDRVRLVHLR